MAIINTFYDTLTSHIIATAAVLQECKILLEKTNELAINAKLVKMSNYAGFCLFVYVAYQAV